jgi:hypothetical protein
MLSRPRSGGVTYIHSRGDLDCTLDLLDTHTDYGSYRALSLIHTVCSSLHTHLVFFALSHTRPLVPASNGVHSPSLIRSPPPSTASYCPDLYSLHLHSLRRWPDLSRRPVTHFLTSSSTNFLQSCLMYSPCSLESRSVFSSQVSFSSGFPLQHSPCLDPYGYVLCALQGRRGGQLPPDPTISLAPFLHPSVAPCDQVSMIMSILQ